MTIDEAANPTAYPLPNEELTAHLYGKAEKARREYFMVEAHEQKVQDALRKGYAVDYTDKRVLHEYDGYPVPAEAIKEAVADLNEYFTKPTHYNDTAITPFQVVNDWELDFYLGNVVKYVCRREKKGNELTDLRKAQAYLNEKIRLLEAQE